MERALFIIEVNNRREAQKLMTLSSVINNVEVTITENFTADTCKGLTYVYN